MFSLHLDKGTYIYLKRQTSSKIATLKSEIFTFEKEKCLVLWYTMDESSSLKIRTAAGNLHQFGQTQYNLNMPWEHISIPLAKGQDSEIIIEGMIGNGNGYIALDDVDIQGWQ